MGSVFQTKRKSSLLEVAMPMCCWFAARPRAERMFSFESGSSAKGILSAEPWSSCAMSLNNWVMICLCLPSRPFGTSAWETDAKRMDAGAECFMLSIRHYRSVIVT